MESLRVRSSSGRGLVIFCMCLSIAVFANCGGVSKSPTPPAPSPGPSASPGLPSNLSLSSVVSGLSVPTDLQSAGDGSGRLFVTEQVGLTRVIQNGALANAPFLDIRNKVTTQGEMGLLGLAFHPSFAQNGKFYVHYDRTNAAGAFQSVIAEYRVGGAGQADPASERILLTVDQPQFTNHKGGQLAFGPDGFLYVALGDGGGKGDPSNNGQNPQTLLAKVLRIDIDTASNGRQYGVPVDNPFVSGGGLPETWAWGFRNPFRFSFDRSTGRMFLGDVGENRFEEVDIVQRGANYGWSTMEANHCFKPTTGCNETGLTMPIFEYDHSGEAGIIGGYVYRGSKITGLQGSYVFGDLSSGHIWALTETSPGNWSRTLLISSGKSITSFGQDQDGELYVLDAAGSVSLLAQ